MALGDAAVSLTRGIGLVAATVLTLVVLVWWLWRDGR